MSGTSYKQDDKQEALTEKRALDRLADLIWPGGDADSEWNVEMLDEIAGILRQSGRFPNGRVLAELTRRQRQLLLAAVINLSSPSSAYVTDGVVRDEIRSVMRGLGGFPSEHTAARKELDDLKAQLFKEPDLPDHERYVVCLISDRIPLSVFQKTYCTLAEAEQAITEDMEKYSHLRRTDYSIRQVSI